MLEFLVVTGTFAGAVQGSDERAALRRAGGLQADEEEGREGDVPPPTQEPGHIQAGQYRPPQICKN